MKQIFAFIVSMLFCSMVFAGGKLSVQGNFENNEVVPQVGLGVYQKITKNFAYNSWTGYGSQELQLKDDANWFTSKQAIDAYFHGFTLSGGFQVYYVLPYKEYRDLVFFKASYDLW